MLRSLLYAMTSSAQLKSSGRDLRRPFLLLLGLSLLCIGWRWRPEARPLWWPTSLSHWWAPRSTGFQLSGHAAHCDVLVVGGTPAGVAAALAAARRGANVVLLESRPKVGGDIVYAMLNMLDIPVRPGTASPIHGIFAEFYEKLGLSFDPAKARRLFDNALAAQPNIRVYCNTRVLQIYKEDDGVHGVQAHHIVNGEAHDWDLGTRVVIDATDDASFATRAGAASYLGREVANRDKKMQSAGLLFSVSGVNWNAVRFYVRGKRLMKSGETRRTVEIDKTPAAVQRFRQAIKTGRPAKVWLRLGGMHQGYAWERGDIAKRYQPVGPDVMLLSINFGRQDDGTVVLNTLNLVNVNGLDPRSREHAMREGRAELPRLMNFLRRVMPGFQKARLARVAPELYIRETRHIQGYYSLKVADVRAETRFFDRVAFASYPLDLHPYVKNQLNPFGPRRYYYTLPLRCLVPRGVDDVFVASRSLSATYSAAGSARVIPVAMAAGEAAGAAAWVCARDRVSPHEIMRDSTRLRLVQKSLREMGADIGDEYPGDRARQNEKEDRPAQ